MLIKYIDYDDIRDDDITVDVRSVEEWINNSPLKLSCPILTKEEHDYLKKRRTLFIPYTASKLYKKRKIIKSTLIRYSENGGRRIILGCTRGRLRSPMVYLYAKYLKLNVLVLKGGLTYYYNKDMTTMEKIKSYFIL